MTANSYPAWMKDLTEKEREEAMELRRQAFPEFCAAEEKESGK